MVSIYLLLSTSQTKAPFLFLIQMVLYHGQIDQTLKVDGAATYFFDLL